MNEEGGGMDDFIFESEPLTEKQLYKLSESLFDEKKLLMISDLNKGQRDTILKLTILDKLFLQKYAKGDTTLKDIRDTMLKLTISSGRQGRKEIIEMFKRIDEKRKEMGKKKGLLGR